MMELPPTPPKFFPNDGFALKGCDSMPSHTPPEPPTHLKCPERREKPANLLLDGLPEVVIEGGTTGASTKVMINGKEIPYLDAVRFETVAGGLSKVTMTFIPKSVSIRTLGEIMEYERELTPSKPRDGDDGVNRLDFTADASDRMYKQTMAKFDRLSALMREAESIMRDIEPKRMDMNVSVRVSHGSGCADERQHGGEHEEVQ